MSTQRTNATEVEGLLGNDLDPARRGGLSFFLRTANVLVDRVVACLAKKKMSLSAEEARLMEALMAAHDYTRSDPTTASESTLGRSGQKHGQTAMDLDASFYGQRAKGLDPSGSCLISIMKGQRASMAWGGRAPSEQTDFADRS